MQLTSPSDAYDDPAWQKYKRNQGNLLLNGFYMPKRAGSTDASHSAARSQNMVCGMLPGERGSKVGIRVAS